MVGGADGGANSLGIFLRQRGVPGGEEVRAQNFAPVGDVAGAIDPRGFLHGGAILGGFLGGIFLSVLPLIGTLFGALIGAIAGMWFIEYRIRGDENAATAAVRAYISGVAATTVLNLLLALAMVALFLWQAWLT